MPARLLTIPNPIATIATAETHNTSLAAKASNPKPKRVADQAIDVPSPLTL